MFNKTKTSDKETATQPDTQPTPENQEQARAAQEGAPEAEGMPDPEAAKDWENKFLQLQDQFTRLAADFENYRKRVREEQEALAKYGAQKTVLELLPVLDNLDRATASLNENSDPKVLFQSFSLMQKQLMNTLDGLGIQRIQAVGQEFNPELHEAVSRMESAEFAENSVMYEAQSGYKLHDKVIRPAQVVVSTGGPEGAAASTATEQPAGAASQDELRSNPFQKQG